MLEQLIEAGLLPGYAFAVDVVGLSVPSLSPHTFSVETPYQDAMQCDLKIALSEYAPGAEVVRGSFPNTYIYRSAGLYDPYAKAPDNSPDGMVLECAAAPHSADTAVCCPWRVPGRATVRRSAMGICHWFRRCALSAILLLALPIAVLARPPRRAIVGPASGGV